MRSPVGEPCRVSVITPVRNGVTSIAAALDSILAQSHHSLELVVVDGRSHDGTVEVIRQRTNRIAWWVSEPDRGISHAFNKGLAQAHGDIIGILNADDCYASDAVARAVATLRDHPEAGGRLFREKGRGKYNDLLDAIRIIQKLPDRTHLQRSDSFRRFEQKLV